MAHLSNFDRWRLSRIAEEMDTLGVSSPDDGCEPSRSRDSTLEWNKRHGHGAGGAGGKLPTSLECLSLGRSTASENIYSKTLIQGLNVSDQADGFVCSSSPSERDANSQGKDALRFIKEKYDSLGKVKVKKPSVPYSVQPLEIGTADGGNTYRCARSTIGGVEDSISIHHVTSGSMTPLAINSGTETAVLSPTLSWADTGRSVTSPLASHGAQAPHSAQAPHGAHAPFNKHTAVLGFVYTSLHNSSAGRITPENVVEQSDDPSPLRSVPRVLSVTSQEIRPARGLSVTSQEIVQVEMFYSSHKTTVSVCPCLAGLYIGTTKSLTASPPPATTAGLTHHHLISNAAFKNDWVFVKSGLPVLVLDSGDSHRGRCLNVVIAEKGTGFSLWRDTVHPLLSEYTVHSPTFHTMCLSTDPHRVVGLSFDDAASAADFSRNLQSQMMDSAEPAHDSRLPASSQQLNDLKKSSRKKSSKIDTSSSKTKGRLSKAAISQPCCFMHVTKLDGRDMAMVLRTDGPWQDRGAASAAGDGRNSPQVHWLTEDRTVEHSGVRHKK